jgi:hypothetical protein
MNYSIYVDTYFFRDEDALNNIEEAPNVYFT